MTLNAIGEPACTQCGAELAPEPEGVSTTLICPRGCGPLSAFADVFECDRCGGLFLDHATLGALVTAHRPKAEGDRRAITMGAPAPNPRESLSPLRFAPRSSITPPPTTLEPVTYLPCPTCNVRMNRTVFGKSSGVVVDVCAAHGTWFDARELTASLAFVERGGIELVERRDRERKAEQQRQAEIAARTKAFDLINRPAGVRGLDPDRAARAEALADLVSVLLSL